MVDMFDNRKIRYLRKLPEGNSIVLIWVMLLSLAGRCNAGGMIHLTRDIPYTTKMLADELDFEENTVVLALKALEGLGMISQDPLSVTNWEEYQSTDKMEQIREQNRLRKQKQRALEAASRDSHVTVTENVTQGHATDIDIEEDIDRDKEKDNNTLSLSERKKDTDTLRTTKNVQPEDAEAVSVFRSFLEREYRNLPPDIRNKFKAWAQELMKLMEAYVRKKREDGKPMTSKDAEAVCNLLGNEQVYKRAEWVRFFKFYVGEESV